VFYRYGFADFGMIPSMIAGGLVLMVNGVICATFLRQRPR